MFKKSKPEMQRDDDFGLESYYRERLRERIMINRIIAALLALALAATTTIANKIGIFDSDPIPTAPPAEHAQPAPRA